MNVNINLISLKKILLYLLLIAVCVSYLGYYIYSYTNNINVYALYSSCDWSSVGFHSNMLRFAKDFIICFLGIVVVLTMKKKRTLFFCLDFGALLSLGTLVVYFTGANGNITAGIRCYLYFFVLLIYTSEMENNCKKISLNILRNIILLMQIINFIVLIEQSVRGTFGNLQIIGQGGYRFAGLFGGNNGCASFSLACVVFWVIYDYYWPRKKISMFLEFIMSVLMCIICGSRSTMINVLLIFVIWLVGKLKCRVRDRIFIIICSIAVLGPAIINFANGVANRGSILQVQMESGRLSILKNIINSSNILQLLFGRGLGIGSNSDTITRIDGINMSVGNGIILDGTFNVVLYQFGLLGFFLMIYILIKGYKMINTKCSLSLLIIYVVTILMQCFTANLFETYGFLVVMFINYWIILGNLSPSGINKEDKRILSIRF